MTNILYSISERMSIPQMTLFAIAAIGTASKTICESLTEVE